MRHRQVSNSRRRLAWCFGVFAALVFVAAAQAQPTRESAVKAAFLYKFGAFVEWPSGAIAKPDQPLVIGVSSDDEVATDLEQLTAGRAVEGHPVQVRRLGETGPFPGVHVLFLGSRKDTKLREALESVNGPVLVVTDQSGALRLGSVLNFMNDGGRVRFAASLASADARGLKLSSRLLSVAQAVEGRK